MAGKWWLGHPNQVIQSVEKRRCQAKQLEGSWLLWDHLGLSVGSSTTIWFRHDMTPLKTSCKHWVFLVGLDCCKLNYKLLLLHHGPVCGKPRCRFQNCIGDLFGRLGLSCQWDRFPKHWKHSAFPIHFEDNLSQSLTHLFAKITLRANKAN